MAKRPLLFWHMCFERADEKWRSELATKADLMEAKSELRAEIAAVRSEITAVRTEIANSRAETIKWTAGMLIAQAALVATMVKFL